ncbi:hypothetical protein LX16_4752 [Stackebrandtia albiflava]|uniref:Cytotoxic translational repressor of toxin-antitoxin stability system n=1 Tax=Stackebrandtia albiflava TaxID=406432 RepID=A0A562UQS7_9ACTN|nr:hypothetical protein LX16_4752 [Stackebrandtia albiflava]
MSPRRGDRVAPPAVGGEWHIRFADNTSAKGWEDLCSQVPSAARTAWDLMRNRPPSVVGNERHHRLKGSLRHSTYRGVVHEQWQIEVTGSGRVWYLADVEHRTCWITYAGVRHPKSTE